MLTLAGFQIANVLAGRDWRTLQPYHISQPRPSDRRGPHRLAARSPRPKSIGVGTWVRVFADVPTLPYCLGRVGRVERVF